MIELGINIDHVATLRQARGTSYPDPAEAARIAEGAGADLITVHLREDRRHIVDRDLEILRKNIETRMNLEMAATSEMVSIATQLCPDDVCLVPEKREELTTEGGLNVSGQKESLRRVTELLQSAGIRVSMFIDPDARQIEASQEVGADAIEIHTGCYADAISESEQKIELQRIVDSVVHGGRIGLKVNAGHGLNYDNTDVIARIVGITELNIGHAIIARSVFVGLAEAVREMRLLIQDESRAG